MFLFIRNHLPEVNDDHDLILEFSTLSQREAGCHAINSNQQFSSSLVKKSCTYKRKPNLVNSTMFICIFILVLNLNFE